MNASQWKPIHNRYPLRSIVYGHICLRTVQLRNWIRYTIRHPRRRWRAQPLARHIIIIG